MSKIASNHRRAILRHDLNNELTVLLFKLRPLLESENLHTKNQAHEAHAVVEKTVFIVKGKEVPAER